MYKNYVPTMRSTLLLNKTISYLVKHALSQLFSVAVRKHHVNEYSFSVLNIATARVPNMTKFLSLVTEFSLIFFVYVN